MECDPLICEGASGSGKTVMEIIKSISYPYVMGYCYCHNDPSTLLKELWWYVKDCLLRFYLRIMNNNVDESTDEAHATVHTVPGMERFWSATSPGTFLTFSKMLRDALEAFPLMNNKDSQFPIYVCLDQLDTLLDWENPAGVELYKDLLLLSKVTT